MYLAYSKGLNREAYVVYPNGDTYEGFINGRSRNGYGVMTYSEEKNSQAMTYEGEWVNDLRHGYGVLRYSNIKISGLTIFEGTWQNDKQCDGTITWADGSYYKGGFYGSYLQGEGILVTKTEILKGTWKRSKLNGIGERIFVQDGSKYVGKWVNGKLTGHGEYISESEHYVGHYFNNLEHGNGK